jgi:hydroxymethylbilane synthase
MKRPHLIIGTRGSELALYQANFIRELLVRDLACEVDLEIIKTSGDKIDNLAFDKMEGKGFFTKELEDALLNCDIDLAVHSLKDLMTTQPKGLKLGAVGYRADRRELLLIRKSAVAKTGLLPVKSGGIIGTSSARRKCQIAYHNPSLIIKELRGNVPTRVRKLRDGEYDAILLAAAGVTRLNLDHSEFAAKYLDAKEFYPAPAQGILGIQIRENDPRVESIISKIGSAEVANEARLERGLLATFSGGCSLPLGVHSACSDGIYTLSAALGVREDERWTGLKKASASGVEIDQIIQEVYSQLKGAPVCCA